MCEVVGCFADPVKTGCMLRVCVHSCVGKWLVLWLYPDIWANFSESHMLFFKRWPVVKNTHTHGLLQTSTCNPDLSHREIHSGEGKQSAFKSQALISVNHILCKALPLDCSWNYSKYQSGSFWPYKEKKGGIRAGLAKVGQAQTFLAYYQHTAFCAQSPPLFSTNLTSRPNSACVSHFPLE